MTADGFGGRLPSCGSGHAPESRVTGFFRLASKIERAFEAALTRP